jgi:uncharacterized protein YjdB
MPTTMTVPLKKRLSFLTIAAVVALTAACSDSDPTGIEDPPVPAEIVVAPESLTLTAPGETADLEVTVLDAEGEEILDPELTFTSSDDEVVEVSESGVVTAIGEGSATVTVSVGELSAEVLVEVTVEEEG